MQDVPPGPEGAQSRFLYLRDGQVIPNPGVLKQGPLPHPVRILGIEAHSHAICAGFEPGLPTGRGAGRLHLHTPQVGRLFGDDAQRYPQRIFLVYVSIAVTPAALRSSSHSGSRKPVANEPDFLSRSSVFGHAIDALEYGATVLGGLLPASRSASCTNSDPSPAVFTSGDLPNGVGPLVIRIQKQLTSRAPAACSVRVVEIGHRFWRRSSFRSARIARRLPVGDRDEVEAQWAGTRFEAPRGARRTYGIPSFLRSCPPPANASMILRMACCT